jgi:hypothetical protein
MAMMDQSKYRQIASNPFVIIMESLLCDGMESAQALAYTLGFTEKQFDFSDVKGEIRKFWKPIARNMTVSKLNLLEACFDVAGLDPDLRSVFCYCGDELMQHVGCLNEKKQERALLRLLEMGFVNRIGKPGFDTWESIPSFAARINSVPILEECEKQEIDLNERNSCESTPFVTAALCNSFEVAEWLLGKEGIELYAVNVIGNNALHAAVAQGHLEMVRLLIANDYEIGDTALHKAAENGHFEVVKALVEYGADINAKNWRGFTPHEMAQKRDHREIASWLVQHEFEGIADVISTPVKANIF